MATDLDHDDAIGPRLRALAARTPVVAPDDAWAGVDRRRRRRRTRHVVGAVAGVAALALGVGAIVSLAADHSSRKKRVEIVAPPPDPPILRVLTPAVATQLAVSPAGPYRAGQRVRVEVQRGQYRVDDPINSGVSVCYAWHAGETCDASVESQPIDSGGRAAPVFDLVLPGWVHTPAGMAACETVRCRVEMVADSGTRIATAPLDIASGPKPREPARIASIRDDATVAVEIDGLEPDATWTAWAQGRDAKAIGDFPAGGFGICAFAEHMVCDALVRPTPPPFDGAPHTLLVPTNRLLLTREGWVDCASVVCAITISRDINVTSIGDSIGSSQEIVALLPYFLPSSATVMHRPRLRIEPPGPARAGDTVTVTLHDPPPNGEPKDWQVGQCKSDDLTISMDCVFRLDTPWLPQPDGSLRQRWQVAACGEPAGCYLAVIPPAKAFPPIARTPRFITPSIT